MDRQLIVDALVNDYGVEREDAVQAVGMAEDYIADQFQAGASGDEVVDDIYNMTAFWSFQLVQPQEM
jgi:hypothetical protein